LGEIFGFAVTAVAKKLAKSGFSVEQAVKAIRRKCPKVPQASIESAYARGKAGRGSAPASLSGAQLKALKSLA